MKELDEDTRKYYLREMGITVWSLRHNTRLSENSDSIVQNSVSEVGLEVDKRPTFSPKKPIRSEKAVVLERENMSLLSDSPTVLGDGFASESFTPHITTDPVLTWNQSSEKVGNQEPDSWEKIIDEINHCQRCSLCKTRNKVVPGMGDRQADWLFVGEGPGKQENLKGKPFVGPSGMLLDAMMKALHMKRGENVYIANVVKCRASESGRDRPPTEEEVAICMPYLKRQIDLIRPKVMVALGKTAAAELLNMDRSVSLGSLRNREHFFEQNGQKIPLIVTFHPSYLLRSPGEKKQAWRDLCRAADIYDKEKEK